MYVYVHVHTPIKNCTLDMQMGIYSSYIMSGPTVKLTSITSITLKLASITCILFVCFIWIGFNSSSNIYIDEHIS